jgi:23S rRNA (cytidine1920-2'-O)/16S rRNA (cytidine1409-2'-O)-methyltransferase
VVVLVKPQFEAGRREVSKGRGVIREPEVWRLALRGAIAALGAAGATMMGVMVSPLRGADGNVEFLSHLSVVSSDAGPGDPAGMIDQVVTEASTGPAGGVERGPTRTTEG